MPKNKFLRIILFVLAIWVVLQLATLITVYMYKGWQQVTNPSTSGIVSGLQSGSEFERGAALDKIIHPIWFEEDIVNTVSDMALNETSPQLKAKAIGLTTQSYMKYASLTREQLAKSKTKPALSSEKIDRIANQVLSEKVEIDLGIHKYQVYQRLYVFLQNTINAQSDHSVYISHLTKMLNGVLESKKHYFKQAKIVDILQTIKTYARHVVIPDETMVVLLETFNKVNSSSSHPAAVIIEIFNNQASKQVFSDDILKMVEHAVINHKNRTLRLTAITALQQQSILTGRLSAALEKSVDDKDDSNAQIASQAIVRFKESQGNKTDQGKDALLAIVLDPNQKPEIRASALLRGASISNTGKLNISPEFFKAAESLLNDPEPIVRATSIRYIRYMRNHELYRQRDSDMLSWLESGLQDEDTLVRKTAINILEYYPDDNSKRSKYVLIGLKDKDREVVLAAMRIISVKKLNTPDIVNKLELLTRSYDTAINSYAKRYHARLQLKNRNIFQTIMHLLSDKNSYGGLLFFAIAIAAIVIAVGFAVYYAYTFVTHVAVKRKRAIASLIALLIWIGLGFALVGFFTFSLFGMGHNTAAPMHEQLAISYRLAGFVVGYGVLGWVMYFFVRVPAKKDEN